MRYKIYKSTDTNVSKFVFETDKSARKPIAVEAVLYRYGTYKKRTVICCSTQCGCPVGCTFCGTGKFFVRNLTAAEIVEQVDKTLATIDCHPREVEKLQIMFMSMGDPFSNYKAVRDAIKELAVKYPNGQLLVSTSAPATPLSFYYEDFIALSIEIPKVGIQFSVHESNDTDRKKLIPTPTTPLNIIGEMGAQWALNTGRQPYFNYCVHKDNAADANVKELLENFPPKIWQVTLSVICEKDNTVKSAIEQNLALIKEFSTKMIEAGYSIRVFNPAGQDDIGGGCGQLWYFQEWFMKNHKK